MTFGGIKVIQMEENDIKEMVAFKSENFVSVYDYLIGGISVKKMNARHLYTVYSYK